MAKLSHEISDDQLDAGIGLEGLSDTDLVDVLKARHICYEAELLSLANKTAYVEELRDANAALLAQYVEVEAPRVELRGAGTLAEVMGKDRAAQYLADKEAMENENSRIADERHPRISLRVQGPGWIYRNRLRG